MTKTSKSKHRKKKRPVPLAPPATMRSRKHARVVTTLFHKYSHERDRAIAKGDAEKVRKAEKNIEKIGGREAYQRASQCSVSFHSTSKWVIGVLGQMGWLNGVPEHTVYDPSEKTPPDAPINERNEGKRPPKKRKVMKIQRRNVRLLEVGAINTELIDAAAKKRPIKTFGSTLSSQDARKNASKCSEEIKDILFEDQPVYRLDVRAIDLRSSHENIEEADFLQLPLIHQDVNNRYDVVVCSMVINCVSSPGERGRMLALLYHQLRPGGLCFLTLPKLCLTQSKYTTQKLFEALLTRDGGGVGFEIAQRKESPKVAFFVLKKPACVKARGESSALNPKWKGVMLINKAKKFRNDFAVTLDEDEVSGRTKLPNSTPDL